VVLSSTQLVSYVRFEVFTAVAVKNAVFWDLKQWGSFKKLQEAYHVTSKETAFFFLNISL
jgi:hypothetical protein